jgi:bifunctional oligoribonuclease and PAP phosphatase NrnA
MSVTTAAAYATTASAQRLAERIRSATSLLVTAHDKPDGDAVGSVLALTRAARALGIRTEAWLAGPFDPALGALLAGDTVCRAPESMPQGDFDLVAVVDTGSWSQMEHLGPWIRGRMDRCIGVDHHRSGDTGFTDRIVDTACASCTQALVPVLDALGARFDAPGTGCAGSIAEALFAGLATDTGWFRFSGADASVFALASRLLRAGVEKDRLYRQLEETARPQRMGLLAHALGGMRWLAGGRAAVMTLSPEDFSRSSGSAEDLAGVVNAPMSVGSVEVSALLSQNEPGPVVKISLRSKPPMARGGAFVDVNRLAGVFGGGGHVHAAGAKFRGTMAQASEAVAEAIERALAR